MVNQRGVFMNMKEYDEYLKKLQKEEEKYAKKIKKDINRTLRWAKWKKFCQVLSNKKGFFPRIHSSKICCLF